mgnify:CR=1 FL=1
MGWPEIMRELEEKLRGTLEGRYRPRDGVPFFRVQYPPAEEREALRRFRELAQHVQRWGHPVYLIRMTEVLREAMARLIGCGEKDLPERLVGLEKTLSRRELRQRLAEHLPRRCTEVLVGRLRDADRRSVAVLARTGALYPFVRPSTLLSGLEGRIRCAVVLAYPTGTIGSFLDAEPAGGQGGYYRGETIRWR